MENKLEKINLEIETTEARLADLKRYLAIQNSKVLESRKDEVKTFDIHYVKSIKDKLKQKENLIQKTEEFFNVGHWRFNFKNRLLEWSPETYNIFEYPEDYKGTLTDFYMSCMDEKSTERFPNISQVLENVSKNSVMNQTVVTSSGTKKFLSFSSFPVYNEAGTIIAVEGLVKDFSDRITGKNGLDNFFNLSYDLHCIVDRDRYFVKVSPSWSKLLGYTEKELLSRSYMDFVHPDDLECTESRDVQNDEESSVLQFENRYITKSGEVVSLSWNSQTDDETQLVFCTARDITKSKLAQSRLLNDLSEKDLLLREIHHRVKNNLQIISSLLSLQSGSNSGEERLNKLYHESQNRIKSMAAIHEMFYQSEELDKIDFGKYMEKLTADLSSSFSALNNIIEFDLNLAPVDVNLDTAIPLGLLINEVVTNSIKHGGDKNGNVHVIVEMKVLADLKLQLIIGDKGTNSQKNILDKSEDSLGMMLINSLVEQIDGEIEQIYDHEGTVFRLIFENKLNVKI